VLLWNLGHNRFVTEEGSGVKK